ncbi:C4-dicarboxylate ABC transporter substrate-binding protein [Kiloniella spongiae]|uniref:C4-dicarboxylate ABC transporter substrate-binding protein n=1 Tax=Kiloniella spongiae TaxID=1489064 RepID=A0A0H2MZK7_9PROT|nr:TRAP transporter substrate-binding protein [Kiloniella spongiae]KLN62090.1 C4-dicarboxylate ABC transporter substrate-binding protein [Kiloniella spongiae]
MFSKFVKTLLAVTAVISLMSTPTFAKTFKLAAGDGPGSSQEATALAFKSALEKLSGGKHSVTLFLNSQLGSEQDTVNDAAIGVLDMTTIAAPNLVPFSPTAGILTLPYVIQSLEEAETLTQGDFGNELRDTTINDAGVRVLTWGYGGFRRLTNSKQPVTSVADLEGLVIRVPKNEILLETYKSWGLSPTPMAWSEVFAALQTKVVDGQENPYSTIYSMKFNEVQKYVTNLRYNFSVEPILVSESVFQSLSEADQKILLEAGRKATAASAAFLRESEERIQANLEKLGMEIHEPENNEAEFIERATKVVWPQFYDSIGGVEKLNATLEILGRDPVK